MDRLLEEGYDVTAVDNLSEGHMENIAHLKHEKRFRFVNHDLKDGVATAKAVKGSDVIFHMAAQANIRKSIVDHRGDLENNLMAMINILDGMVEHRVKEMVFASSSAVYGEAMVTPTPEDYLSHQTSLYGASKLASEGWAESFVQFAPIKVWSFRFANVVGERCRRGVVWDFVHKLQKNPNELEILGNGKQSKEYLYVKDCVEGMMTGWRKSRGPVEAFNLGQPRQTLVDEVADLVIEEMKLDGPKRKYTGGEHGWIGDNKLVELSLQKMKNLGWEPKVSPEEAIRMTARWTMATS
ncbi:MAG: NAD-dependent epimerase/dehydratase family protein [Nitrososphaerota archaeon]|nr:NAD-dependent epimerase/dehydratase family protein [Nitrososphaerota archaeon]